MIYSYRDVILFLNMARISNLTIINIISEGMLQKFLDINEKNLKHLYFLNSNDLEKIKNTIINLDIDYEKEKLYSYEINFVTILDENYPKMLKNIYDAPAIIYYKGKSIEILENSIAIVGSRKPTEYGIWVTKKIIEDLKAYDISIISGMAMGIDYFAHKYSIENNLSTVGILASSLEIIYPRSNKLLYDEMKKELLISEFPLDTYPLKRNFVLRNRIISGLSLGTLIVEAQEKSGSLITARYALEQNREVYSIPGNINNENSIGTNDLIRLGAKLILSGKDIIEDFPKIKLKKINKISEKLLYDENTIKILEVLKNNILNFDDLVKLTNMKIEDVYSIVLQLEIDGVVSNIRDNYYTFNN